jgi:hypothetical protein
MGRIYTGTLITVLLFTSLGTFGQGLGGNNGRIEEDFKFLPIPYINYNRSIGFQLGALPMAQFNPVSKDTLSPSSIAGLFGMYSTNKTYFLMAFGKLYFDKDNWRFTTALGTGSVNFQFYLDVPVDSWVPYNTEMDIFYIEAQRRIYKKIYFGLSYVYVKFDTETEITEGVFTTKLNGLGLKLTMDYRKNVYYPREDFFNNLKYFTYPEWMGNESSSRKIEINHNHFFPLRGGQDVVAGRIYVGLGLGDLTFNQQFIVGRGDDIRGYTQGEFRGNHMTAIQGEYRWNLDESKFGFVGFFGLATVFEAINEDHNGQILPGAGVGFRFKVSEETNMNVGMDVAVGKDDWGLYFRLGESFSN